MEAWREELYHHGILGMKWGRQNGPPYPLGKGQHSASEVRKTGKANIAKMLSDRKKKKAKAKALERARQAKAANAEAKRKQEELAANKEKVLATGKASEVMKYKGQLSSDEYAQVFKRLENEQKLASLSSKEVKSGYDKAMATLKKIGEVSDAVESGIKGYNTAVKLVNSLAGTNLPKIKDKNDKVNYDDLKKRELYLQEKNKTAKSDMELEKAKYNHKQWKDHLGDDEKKKKKKG